MKKFKSNLVMFLIFVSYVAIVLIVMAGSEPGNKGALILGLPMSLIYTLVCFFKKSVRSKMTFWWGILSLACFVWWLYLLGS
jgi:hypothetical protein